MNMVIDKHFQQEIPGSPDDFLPYFLEMFGNLGRDELVSIQLRHYIFSTWVILQDDVTRDGYFVCQYFNQKGFTSSKSYPSPVEALNGAIQDGFFILDSTALERNCTRHAWYGRALPH